MSKTTREMTELARQAKQEGKLDELEENSDDQLESVIVDSIPRASATGSRGRTPVNITQELLMEIVVDSKGKRDILFGTRGAVVMLLKNELQDILWAIYGVTFGRPNLAALVPGLIDQYKQYQRGELSFKQIAKNWPRMILALPASENHDDTAFILELKRWAGVMDKLANIDRNVRVEFGTGKIRQLVDEMSKLPESNVLRKLLPPETLQIAKHRLEQLSRILAELERFAALPEEASVADYLNVLISCGLLKEGLPNEWLWLDDLFKEFDLLWRAINLHPNQNAPWYEQPMWILELVSRSKLQGIISTHVTNYLNPCFDYLAQFAKVTPALRSMLEVQDSRPLLAKLAIALKSPSVIELLPESLKKYISAAAATINVDATGLISFGSSLDQWLATPPGKAVSAGALSAMPAPLRDLANGFTEWAQTLFDLYQSYPGQDAGYPAQARWMLELLQNERNQPRVASILPGLPEGIHLALAPMEAMLAVWTQVERYPESGTLLDRMAWGMSALADRGVQQTLGYLLGEEMANQLIAPFKLVQQAEPLPAGATAKESAEWGARFLRQPETQEFLLQVQLPAERLQQLMSWGPAAIQTATTLYDAAQASTWRESLSTLLSGAYTVLRQEIGKRPEVLLEALGKYPLLYPALTVLKWYREKPGDQTWTESAHWLSDQAMKEVVGYFGYGAAQSAVHSLASWFPTIRKLAPELASMWKIARTHGVETVLYRACQVLREAEELQFSSTTQQLLNVIPLLPAIWTAQSIYRAKNDASQMERFDYIVSHFEASGQPAVRDAAIRLKSHVTQKIIDWTTKQWESMPTIQWGTQAVASELQPSTSTSDGNDAVMAHSEAIASALEAGEGPAPYYIAHYAPRKILSGRSQLLTGGGFASLAIAAVLFINIKSGRADARSSGTDIAEDQSNSSLQGALLPSPDARHADRTDSETITGGEHVPLVPTGEVAVQIEDEYISINMPDDELDGPYRETTAPVPSSGQRHAKIAAIGFGLLGLGLMAGSAASWWWENQPHLQNEFENSIGDPEFIQWKLREETRLEHMAEILGDLKTLEDLLEAHSSDERNGEEIIDLYRQIETEFLDEATGGEDCLNLSDVQPSAMPLTVARKRKKRAAAGNYPTLTEYNLLANIIKSERQERNRLRDLIMKINGIISGLKTKRKSHQHALKRISIKRDFADQLNEMIKDVDLELDFWNPKLLEAENALSNIDSKLLVKDNRMKEIEVRANFEKILKEGNRGSIQAAYASRTESVVSLYGQEEMLRGKKVAYANTISHLKAESIKGYVGAKNKRTHFDPKIQELELEKVSIDRQLRSAIDTRSREEDELTELKSHLPSQATIEQPSLAWLVAEQMVQSRSASDRSETLLGKMGDRYVDSAIESVLRDELKNAVPTNMSLTDQFIVEYELAAVGTPPKPEYKTKLFTLKQIAAGDHIRPEFSGFLGYNMVNKISSGNKEYTPDFLELLLNKSKDQSDYSLQSKIENRFARDLTEVKYDASIREEYAKWGKGRLHDILISLYSEMEVSNKSGSDDFLIREWLSGFISEKLVGYKNRIVPGVVAIGTSERCLLVSIHNSDVVSFVNGTRNDKLDAFIKEHLSVKDRASSVILSQELSPPLNAYLSSKNSIAASKYWQTSQLELRNSSEVYGELWRSFIDNRILDLKEYVKTPLEKRAEINLMYKKQLIMALELVTELATLGKFHGLKHLWGLAAGFGLGLWRENVNQEIADIKGVQESDAEFDGLLLGISLSPLAKSVFGKTFSAAMVKQGFKVGYARAKTAVKKWKETFNLSGREKSIWFAKNGVDQTDFFGKIEAPDGSSIKAILNLQKLTGEIADADAIRLGRSARDFLGGIGNEISDINDLQHLKGGYRVIFKDDTGARIIGSGISIGNGEVVMASEGVAGTQAKLRKLNMRDSINTSGGVQIDGISGGVKVFSQSYDDIPAYRTENNLLSRGSIGSVYKIDENYVAKDYSGFIDETHRGRLDSAKNTEKAFKRLYGKDAAIVVVRRTAVEGQESVSVIMSRVPGESLESLISNPIGNKEKLDLLWAKYNEDGESIIDEMVGGLRLNGIDHNDINLGNILYDSNSNKFNIIDFDSSNILPLGEILSDAKSKAIRESIARNFNELRRRYISVMPPVDVASSYPIHSFRSNKFRDAARDNIASGISNGVCWDFSIDVLERAGSISKNQAIVLKRGFVDAGRGVKQVDELLNKPDIISDAQSLNSIPPGQIVVFMDGNEVKHAVTSIGGGRFAGMKNDYLDPSLGAGKIIIPGEAFGRFSGDDRFTTYGGRSLTIKAGYPMGANSQAIHQKDQFLPTRRLLGPDSALDFTTVPGVVTITAHGAPYNVNYADPYEFYHNVRALLKSSQQDIGKIQIIRLHICGAGWGGAKSTAQVLANNFNIKVEAYPYWVKVKNLRKPEWWGENKKVFTPNQSQSVGENSSMKKHDWWTIILDMRSRIRASRAPHGIAKRSTANLPQSFNALPLDVHEMLECIIELVDRKIEISDFLRRLEYFSSSREFLIDILNSFQDYSDMEYNDDFPEICLDVIASNEKAYLMMDRFD